MEFQSEVTEICGLQERREGEEDESDEFHEVVLEGGFVGYWLKVKKPLSSASSTVKVAVPLAFVRTVAGVVGMTVNDSRSGE